MDIGRHNQAAWDRAAREGGEWSRPVSGDIIAKAREGDWEIILTPRRPVPRDWLGDVRGQEILCLASGGGQQAPVLAAAGARVVSFDLSEEQLALDGLVAEREGLKIRRVQGDMRDLSPLEDQRFHLIFNPVSTVFVPTLEPVWRECHRVLKPGGALLTGFMNPAFFLFDHHEAQRSGVLVARYPLPYSEAEPEGIPPARRNDISNGEAMEFSHSLEAQIGGQMEAGLVLTGLYEDTWTHEATPLDRLAPTFIATRAIRPAIPGEHALAGAALRQH